MNVTVVIPVLNEADRILQRIREVEEQAFHQLIIVDGGSSDGTPQLIGAYDGRLKPTLIPSSSGRAQQMNLGAAQATGDALLFLHADTQLPNTARLDILNALTDPGVVGGAFRTWHIDDRSELERATHRRPMASLWLHLADGRSRYSTLPYGDQALFVERAIFEALGGFPEQALMEDLEFSKQLRHKGHIKILASSVRVSGRRFLSKPLRYCLITNTFPLLYRLGVSPSRLAKLYHHVR